MQKTKRFRLLTILLAVVTMFALSMQVYAATSKSVTQDGITATLVTDKDSYKTGESVDATVKVENNSGKDATISIQITVPSALKLAGASTFETVLASGKTWTSAAGSSGDTAGGPTTGDNMQVGLWSVVAILAIAGFVVLLVYGKNRKTWISMLLCVVMIGGFVAAAVPAQAASVSDSMNLSCPIQLDGQAAEVTAVVSNIIADDEGSEGTTTPTEPSTEPTDPSTEPTEPSTEPTDPTEPSETLSESAYYVVWDDFTFGAINSGTEVMSSSWDLMIPSGEAVAGGGNLTIPDSSEYAGSQAQRAFNAISDDFTMEFAMRATTAFEDAHVDIRNGETTAIRFVFKGDKLYLNDVELGAVPTSNSTFKLHISPANGTFTISIDGETVMDGDAAKEFAFLNDCAAIDRLFVETNEEETGTISFGTVRVYVGYYVNEKFLDGTTLAINDEWTVTGDAATIYKTGTQGPDKYNALLKDGASISRDVAYAQDGAWVEYQHLMEENAGEFRMTLTDADGNEFVVATKNGKFGYYNGDAFVGLYDCVANMWYHVMLKQTDDGAELYLNHKLQADKLPNVKFTNISFSAAGGEAMLDDIVVKDWLPLPDDYVPAPVAVEKEEGAKLVGMQSCNLWVEGEHFGYDWLTDWEERKPVLGYYDEISSESADWELKFKIEHGIDFELYCWYRPQDGQGEPIKMARNSRALHEGYMNAEYSDQMKFAITWEAGGGGKDLQDFKDNIVPYWIEQYFKDDRYLVIDNKPLIGMYNITKLQSYFGGTIAGVKEAMDYLRQACVDAGFDGAYIIMCNSSASSAQQIAQAGFDGQYAYTWGSSSNVAATQTKGMESMQAALEAAGWASSGVVPTVSQGFWSKAWDREDGNYVSVETFQKVLEWVKDFMPTLDQNSIGSKVVLLDNWNEYGEGHFIMPAGLAGFGYVDAIKTVFGDGEACNEAVQHVVPTGAQCDRIQHMYIQDRHVVLVDKDGAASDVVPMEGYNWTFEVDGDTEGWAVGYNDGRWIKELKDWAVKDGDFYGLTFTPDELSAKVESGELPSLATADPSVMSPDNLGLNASSAIAIKIRMKGADGVSPIGNPAIYFITEEDQKWSGGKMVEAFYEEGADGYAEITFNMTTNTLWEGTIKQLRFDPIERDGEFWIDSIQIMKRVEAGDAEIYLDGNRVYTAAPIETVDGDYMFPLDELDSLLDVYVRESLAKDRLYISTESALFEFHYEGDTKLIVNGEAVAEATGLVTINDMVYVSISDLFENIGTVTDSVGGEHPAYTIKVAPPTANAKAKVYINKYVDSSILKGYYFVGGTEEWTWGGGNTTSQPAIDGEGSITMSANGSNTKLWSPQNDQFNININKADHFRMRVKMDAAVTNPSLKIDAYGDETTYSYTYNITLTEDMLGEDGFYTVLVSLEDAKAAGLMPAAEFDRVCIWWYNEAAGDEQSFWMDSFEILDLIEDDVPDEEPEEAAKVVVEESPYTIYDWDFTESQSNWIVGGTTSVKHNAGLGSLTVTCANNRMNTWSSNTNSDGTIAHPMNVSAAEATHILVRVQSEAELTAMALDLEFIKEDGTSNGSVAYNDIPYVTDVNGDLYALVDLASAAGYDTTKTIGRISIYPVGRTITEADNGKVVEITSVEVLDKNWYIEFDSVYFTNSQDGFVNGGTTQLSNAEQSLVVAPPTATDADGNLTDFNPRLWSMNNVPGSSTPTTPYGYTADDVTHIRVRLKAVIPETLTADEKAALPKTEELKLIVQFSNGEDAGSKTLEYEIGTEDYQTLCFDISDLYVNGKTLGRIGFNVFDGTNQQLCEAGVTVMIDSVQFLRRTSEGDDSQPLKVLIIGNSITQHDRRDSYGWAGDWGMAATSADKDYVHLLEDSILAKNGAVEVKAINISEYEKYFYDWSQIADAKDKYANWNADIIIATFGANVKNGANENDSGYENNYVFSTAKYKKIIDKFNPDGDATVIAGATVLTSEQIVKIIKDAAAQYGYTYVDMTEWTAREYLAYDYEDEILAYYQQVTGDTTKTSVYEGVLGHPGNKGMEKIAEELWTALEPMIPQGIPAVDEGGDEVDVPEPLKRYDFEGSTENWAWGGGDTAKDESGIWIFGNLDEHSLVITSAGSNSKIWSPQDPKYHMNISLSDLTHIRMRVKTTAEVENPSFDIELYTYSEAEDDSLKLVTKNDVAIVAGEDGWADVVIDLTDMDWGTYTELDRVCIYPYNGSGENETFSMDYIEFLPEGVIETEDEGDTGTPDEGGEEERDILLAYYFDTGSEGWANGGAYTLPGRAGAYGLNFRVGEDADSDWQNGSFKSPAFDPVLTASEVGSICMKLTTTAEAPKKLKVTCYEQGGFAGKSVDITVDWGEAVDGVYTIVVDCATLSQSIETVGSIRIYPVAEYVDATTNGEYWLESVEFIRVSDDEEVPVTPEVPTYIVVKAFTFDSSNEGFARGGDKNQLEAVDGTIVVTAGDDNLRIWSPYVDLKTADVTHLRIKVKTTATDPQFGAYGEFDNDTKYNINYNRVAYTAGTEEFQEVIIDLTADAKWATFTELDRFCIYPFSNNIGETATIDSVELLKLVTE